MRVRRFHDFALLARHATPMLLRDEAENCFFLGQFSLPNTPADAVLCAVEDGVDVVAVGTMTPPWHMMMTAAPAEAVTALTEYLHDERIDLPGVQGPREAVALFAPQWAKLTGKTPRPGKEMAVHRLDRVIAPPRPAAGSMRFADERDVDLVARWITALRIDIGEAMPGDPREIAARRIAGREIVFWHDGGAPVSMAGAYAPTPNGIRVVLVYTPPQQRKRGYASSLVAALSQHLLDSGRKFCFLYTDLANPTANKIYREVGYERISDSVQVFFD